MTTDEDVRLVCKSVFMKPRVQVTENEVGCLKGARRWARWSQRGTWAAARHAGGLRGVSGRPRAVNVMDGGWID